MIKKETKKKTLPIVNKYIKDLHKELKEETDSFFYVFRGQPNVDDLLDCSASRIFDQDKKNDKKLLKDKQVKLINDLRIRRLSKENQRELHDLELLADLRHYGTPSCLIDFTSNFLTALWFACESEHNKDGKIFILNCYDTENFSVVSSKNIEKKIDYFFEEKFNRLWYWIPERLNPRLTDQDAVFIFGQSEIKNYDCIDIKKDDKEDIQKELEKFFDYTKKTLFSDEYALAETYKNFGEKDEDYWELCLEESIHYIQTGEFNKAKEQLIEIKKRDDFLKTDKKKLFLEAHYQSAFADIESIKLELKQKKKEEKKIHKNKIISMASRHLDAIEKEDIEKIHIKDFEFCISEGYKKERANQIKKDFKRTLLGFLSPQR